MSFAPLRLPIDVLRYRQRATAPPSLAGSFQTPRRAAGFGAFTILLASAVLLVAANPDSAHAAGARETVPAPAKVIDSGPGAVRAARDRSADLMLSPWNLSVGLEGTGFGNVTSSPGMINCGSQGASCTDAFVDGTLVTLNAIPEPKSSFEGWSGDPPCAGAFTISADTICVATFSTGPGEHVFADGFEEQMNGLARNIEFAYNTVHTPYDSAAHRRGAIKLFTNSSQPTHVWTPETPIWLYRNSLRHRLNWVRGIAWQALRQERSRATPSPGADRLPGRSCRG